MITVSLLAGCAGRAPNARVATDLNPATTQPSYWFDQPAAKVLADDFDQLWGVCEETARDYLFDVDRRDYRGGVLTTEPLVSSQWFEFWRPDVRTIGASQESSLATMRRTVRFEFTRTPDGKFEVAPKVLVERNAVAETRITSVVSYRGIFALPRKKDERPYGTRESDVGLALPSRYWYPTGRDTALESALLDSIQKKLRSLSLAGRGSG